MKYENFEDVPVWKDGIRLTVNVFAVTEHPAFRGRGDLANQIQRAALSVPNNIAEGFERGTTPELLQFLYYAKGSAGEVRSICHVLERMQPFEPLKSEISDLKSLSRSISRQLGGWAFSLQESDIKGSRHLTRQSKSAYQKQQDAQALMDEIRAINAEEAEKRRQR
nr:four helix bundle protein [uncultured Desulfuromonas sp.]